MKNLLLILSLLISWNISATTYTKSVTASGATYNNGVTDFDGGGADSLVAGDTLIFAVGTHIGFQTFQNFIGTKANPIVIDMNGQTLNLQDNAGWTGLTFESTNNHLKIIGSGGKIDSCNTGQFPIRGFGGSYIIEGITVNGGGQCIGIHEDGASARRTDWTNGISNEYIVIRDCNLNTCNFEGIYIGSSSTYTWKLDGNNELYRHPLVDSVVVERNTVSSCQNDGIQVASTEAYIRDNTITDVGLSGTAGQISGVQVNNGTVAYVYNNLVDSTRGPGLGIQNGKTWAWNNIIKGADNAVSLTHTLNENNGEYIIFNNTFVNIDGTAVHNFNGLARNNKLWNNIIHLTAAEGGSHQYYADGGGNGTRVMDERNNLEVHSPSGLTALAFTNYANNDFTLQGSSTAKGGGLNINFQFLEVVENFNNNRRPVRGAWDRGAH